MYMYVYMYIYIYIYMYMCPLVHLRKLSSVTVGALQMSEMRVLCQYTNFSLVVVLVCCVQEHVQQQAV